MEEDVIYRRTDNWEYIIGNHTVLFNTKEDAIFYMLDDIDTLISGKLKWRPLICLLYRLRR